MTITNEELDRLEALANAATCGPWYVVRRNEKEKYVRNDGGLVSNTPAPFHYAGQDERFEQERNEYENTIDFIAASRSAIPALIEEIRRLRGLNKWQPIESAPRDGTKVWVWWETKGKFPIKEMSILQWRKDQWHWCESPNRPCLRMFPDFTPLLWMPLPQPPQSIGEQK